MANEIILGGDRPIQRLQPQAECCVPKSDPNRVPNCQRCGKPMKLVGESEHNWQWGCEPCGCAHVFSKPRAKEAAQYFAGLQRQEQANRLRATIESRKKYFILGGK